MHRLPSIFAFALLGLILGTGLSFLQPLRYSSSVRLLILQEIPSADAYAVSRSVERLADNFATLVHTTAFFDEVMNAGFAIDQSVFSQQDYKRRREWNRMVSASVSRGTGLLTVRAYHENPSQAQEVVNAVAFVLRRDAHVYVPGSDIDVRLVDRALNSRWPVKPNVVANGLTGLFLGALIATALIVWDEEKARRRRAHHG